PLNTTTLSAFSRVRESGSVAQAYLRVTKVCALLACPVYFGAAAVGPEFIVVCFGAKWSDSGSVMMCLAFLGAAALLNNFSQAALTAMGETRLVFYQALFGLITNALLVLATVWFGVTAVAAGIAIRAYLVNPFILWALKRGLGLSPWRALRGIAPPALSSVLM